MDSVLQELLCKADSAGLREGENVMRASCVHSLKTLEKRLRLGFSGNMLYHIDYYRAHTYSEELRELSPARSGFQIDKRCSKETLFNR